MADRSEIADHYQNLQERLCASFAALDGTADFGTEHWDRPEGGGGLTRVLEGGDILEKAAVNTSIVHGPTPPRLVESLGTTGTFFATGISLIAHPRNPHAPTMHANLRYFETDSGHAWFGGGADLTPWLLYRDDAEYFHRTLVNVCAAHRVADYDAWKMACDEYFYLPHRHEARGIGGIFFDHLTNNLAEVWDFQKDLGDAIPVLYEPIVRRRANTPATADETVWHHQRRGRYAEFNLAWDRGTRFGLETGGRAESILVSLPPAVRWDHTPIAPPTRNAQDLLDALEKPQAWADTD